MQLQREQAMNVRQTSPPVSCFLRAIEVVDFLPRVCV